MVSVVHSAIREPANAVLSESSNYIKKALHGVVESEIKGKFPKAVNGIKKKVGTWKLTEVQLIAG